MKSTLKYLRLSLMLLILLMGGAKQATAISCDIYMGGKQMVFGTLNVLDGQAKSTTATISYGCSGAPEPLTVLICLSLGSGPNSNVDQRYLTSGDRDQLAFNLYTDASMSAVWGSIDAGGGASGVPLLLQLPAYKRGEATAQIYGSISPRGQTGLPAGHYDATWPAKINYRVHQPGMPVSCESTFTGQADTEFYIQAVIAKDCRIESASPLDFGSVAGVMPQHLDANAIISVICNGTAYRVGLDDGRHARDKVRRMSGPRGYIEYELYRDSGRTERWGNNFWYDGVARTGTGVTQSLTVYGRVPMQPLAGSGVYSDTITVTVDY